MQTNAWSYLFITILALTSCFGLSKAVNPQADQTIHTVEHSALMPTVLHFKSVTRASDPHFGKNFLFLVSQLLQLEIQKTNRVFTIQKLDLFLLQYLLFSQGQTRSPPFLERHS